MPLATNLARTPVGTRALRCIVAAVATAGIAAGPAFAATRTASSPVTGMNATLAGTQLTVTPGERVSSAFLRSVQGRPVTVACATGGEDLMRIAEGETLVPDFNFDFAVLGGPAAWPSGGNSLSYTLARDVSEKVDACLVGRDPAALSTFGFNALGRGVLREGLAEQRLLLAHHAAKLVARDRPSRRFPSARSLAAALAASEPQLQVAFAPTVRRARRNDVVYVIGRGTSFKRVHLAHRENDGQPVELEGRRRGEPELKSPERESGLMPGPHEDGRRRPRARAG